VSKPTSLEAYYTKVLPHLAWSQAQIYKMLLDATNKGFDMTNMELAKALNWSINRVTPRVLELRKMGIVVLSCKRKCGATHNNAYAWKTK
jgi:DNA-binding Lrp family transcriptional regulator